VLEQSWDVLDAMGLKGKCHKYEGEHASQLPAGEPQAHGPNGKTAAKCRPRWIKQHGRAESFRRGNLIHLSFSITRKGFSCILFHLNENAKTN
jgi:hypothetical protein